MINEIVIAFWVSMCSHITYPDNISSLQCNSYIPMSWTVTNEDQRNKAFEECSILANAYDQLESVRETDCYIEE